MKKIYLILASAIAIASCGDQKEPSLKEVIATGDLTEIRAKKKEIEEKQKEISVQLDSLSAAISKLDKTTKFPLVTTFKAENVVFKHYLELQGNVSTKQNVLVYPETQGIIESIPVVEGQRVKKGDVLATINDGGISEQLGQLEAQEKLAKTIYEKQKRLWDQNIGSEIDFLQAETNYLALSNNVAQLNTQLDKSKIVAPFDGTVDAILQDKGSVIGPGVGSEMFRIINLTNMKIKAEVPEKYIASVKKGKEVSIYFPVLGKTVDTKIKHVGNYINPNNRSFVIELNVPNEDREIKPNMSARLKVNDYTNNNAVLIPQSIISENAEGEQYVYIAKNKKGNNATVEKTFITTGKTQDNVIEVLSALTEGTEVIEEGARSVNEGQTVVIIK
ncbi:efflux RND transporter periplasmic adaptor subunit [Flavicella sediminum]|uniref:efflux RND transporter periplasmic adaptor subunit n=1 Tax=Flavicella sediminum TaxID=2585141 RepID=UPI0011220FED|nr:efflux RND transporter periplasmic adaptor subunit [Flavicella sediminum]